ncbi:MAG: YggS family pyridoxal phosphate-dependent enzyme [Synergistales bacterium]|nr:YggS family pyridoxal phosphate-dependent enzyme [Synergistales bacterium]
MVISVPERVEWVRERIDLACERCGRHREEITVVAASKYQSMERMQAVAEAGIRIFGENRVQEALSKQEEWSGDLPPVEWHLLGHLQRNKARKAVPSFALIQSLDSQRLADRLQQLAGEYGTVEVLVEVNTSGESAKHGIAPGESDRLFEHLLRECPGISPRGLMTVGPLTGDDAETSRAFGLLRREGERLAERFGLSLPILSMGMSGDFECAIEEGSTMVRLGSVLFGPRGG